MNQPEEAESINKNLNENQSEEIRTFNYENFSVTINPCQKCQAICPEKCVCLDTLPQIDSQQPNEANPCQKCEVICPEKCICLDTIPQRPDEVNPCQKCQVLCPEKCICLDPLPPMDATSPCKVNPCHKCQVICPEKCICLDTLPRVDPKRPCGRCQADCPEKCTCKDPLFLTLHQFKCTLCPPGQCTCGKVIEKREIKREICGKEPPEKPKEIDSKELCICKEICLCKKASDCTCVKCQCQNQQRPIYIPGTKKIALNERPQDLYFLSEMNKSQRRADDYLEKHRIFEFFHFLMCHLLANLPANPVEFLLKLLKDLITYRRNKNIPPPVLFEERHLESVYNAMDPMRTGVISVNQYIAGLKTLGLRNFNREPPLTLTGMITKNIFLDEARKRQIWELDDLLEIIKRPEKQKPQKKSNKKINLKAIPL